VNLSSFAKLFSFKERNEMVDVNNAKDIAALLGQIRLLSQKHLPISHSYIPYDILLTIFTRTLNEDPPSIKALFADLKHSESGTRYHFDRLIGSGWIDLIQHGTDNRVKLCVINKNCEERLTQYLADVGQLTYEVVNGRRCR